MFAPQATAPILAARVPAALQARSIVSNFDAKNAKVDCVSKAHVEFRVRLYRGRGEYSHGLIVEVQRRMGFDLSYSQDVFAILDAAEGKANAQDFSIGMTTPIYYEGTETECGCSSDDDDEDMDSLENTAGFTSLRVISDVLCPEDEDKITVEGRDFALASLASLTSLERMGQTAVVISNELLTSETRADLRHAVFSNIGIAPSLQDDCHVPHRVMCQSLEVLKNVAICAQNPSRLADFLSQDNNGILNKLIENIESAHLNPRAADLSCVVLKSIQDSSQTALEVICRHHARRNVWHHHWPMP